MTYNHKKTAKTEDSPKPYSKSLNDYNKEWDNTVDKEKTVESYQGLLRENRGSGQGENLDVVTESQMTSEHKSSYNHRDETTESQLDKRKSEYPHRQSGIDDAFMKPHDALSEGLDRKFHDKYKKTVGKGGRYSRIVDKGIGEQMSGSVTKQQSQVPDSGSQLNVSPGRFKSVSASNMAAEAMKDADAVLFYLYHKSASEGRELTNHEKKIESQITKDKRTILSQFQDNPLDPMGVNPMKPDPMGIDPMKPDPMGIDPVEETGGVDASIIEELLGDDVVDNVGMESDLDMVDQLNPDFDNIHNQERQDMGFDYID